MRVIAGIAKGTKLYTPSNKLIRPTLDRVRTSLFDIIGSGIEGKFFIDLFAGTGANGIEALSRGAERVWFVDNSPQALELVRKNLVKTHMTDKAEVIKAKLPEELELLPSGMDYVFIDPPYSFERWEELITGLINHNVVNLGSLLILEHSRKNHPSEVFGYLHLIRQEKYGDTFLSFYASTDD